MEPIDVRYAESVARPAREVWQTLSALRGAAMPRVVQDASTHADADGHTVQHIRFSDTVALDQRVIERDDEQMLMRFELSGTEGMPMGACRVAWRVVPTDAAACEVSVHCTGAVPGDAQAVQGMLRNLYLLGIAQLKSRMETNP